MYALIVTLAIAQTQPLDANARAAVAVALALHQAPASKEADSAPATAAAPCQCLAGGPCRCGDDCPCEWARYGELRAQAVAEGKPLLVFVGCAPLESSQWLALQMRSFSKVSFPRLLVSMPAEGDLWKVAEIAAASTRAQIADALCRGRSRLPASQPQRKEVIHISPRTSYMVPTFAPTLSQPAMRSAGSC